MRLLPNIAAATTTLAALLLAAPSGHASLPGPDAVTDAAWLDAVPEYSAGKAAVDVRMRNEAGAKMLNRMLNEDGFWSDAKVYNYKEKHLYDEIRLKPLPEGGYVPMITGESDEDIPQDVVADIVFGQQTALPKYMSGAVAVKTLGWGTDPDYGIPYLDNYFVLDMSFFYMTYTQRMYRKTVDGKSYLWFEKLDKTFVDAATWTDYQKQIEDTMGGIKLRSFFGGVLPVGEIYGMFLVTDGENRESRVTFVSKISFDKNAGWLAKLGSKMPPVLKAGLQSGFDASVRIAKAERDRRPG